VTARDGTALFCDRVGWGDRVIVQDSRTFFCNGLGGDIVIIQESERFLKRVGWRYYDCTG
jgi:hypothetical protein